MSGLEQPPSGLSEHADQLEQGLKATWDGGGWAAGREEPRRSRWGGEAPKHLGRNGGEARRPRGWGWGREGASSLRECLSSCLPLFPQRMVLEQAAQDSSPPDVRMQYLHQIQASHEVRPWASC